MLPSGLYRVIQSKGGRMKNWVFIGTGLLLFSCQAKFPGESKSLEKKTFVPKPTSKEVDLNQLIDSLKMNRNQIHLRIFKSSYLLEVLHDTTVLKTYPVVFGFNPIDDKLKQGDGCTPEGVFAIRSKYPHASWSKFIWIDYPNKDSWAKHKKAKQDKTIPQGAPIGGEVGIHGVPTGFDYMIDEKENWTLGCISLKTKDINEIYDALGPKSKIFIYHSLN